VALCVAACGQGGPASSATSTTASSRQSGQLTPANIDRVRGELPVDYEVADVVGRGSPVAFWGFGPDWVADPPQCGTLARPVVDGATTRGWSGSGAGGIVYAVVTGSLPAPGVTFDPAVVGECGQWTVASGHTTGSVTLVEAPRIDGAATVGMATAAKTVVEGGTETYSRADTFTAYLGDYLAVVTVVTDPGSPNPQLGQDFAAALLVKTVSALRG
jgi:hypothetical protein